MAIDVVSKLRPIIEKIVEDNNVHLYNLEYVKEDGNWFLRVSIEKDDGTMDFETAEVVSDVISSKLDELDPIDHEYILDVCSPGIERPLKTLDDYKNNVGNYITVYLTELDVNGKDSYTGDLTKVDENEIELSYKDKTRLKKVTIGFQNIDKAHIAIKF